MRRMYSENELRTFIKKYIRESGDDVVASLVGKDLSIEGLTSKGIANTGSFANIGDVAISGDLIVQGEDKGNIVASTLKQINPNFELDLGSIIEALSDENKTFTNIYSKLVVYNRIAYIIINYKITAINSGTYGDSVISIPNIPEEIGKKIFDMLGNDLTKSTQTATITILIGGKSTNGQSTWSGIVNAFFNHAGANTIQVYLGAGQSMSANEEKYYTLRSFITI